MYTDLTVSVISISHKVQHFIIQILNEKLYNEAEKSFCTTVKTVFDSYDYFMNQVRENKDMLNGNYIQKAKELKEFVQKIAGNLINNSKSVG